MSDDAPVTTAVLPWSVVVARVLIFFEAAFAMIIAIFGVFLLGIWGIFATMDRGSGALASWGSSILFVLGIGLAFSALIILMAIKMPRSRWAYMGQVVVQALLTAAGVYSLTGIEPANAVFTIIGFVLPAAILLLLLTNSQVWTRHREGS